MRTIPQGVDMTIVESLERYVNDRIPTGNFLRAVLENDLREAFGRADDRNIRDMYHIVCYCYNKLPANCWGSKEVVQGWLERKDQT